jgi:hypothetical protein
MSKKLLLKTFLLQVFILCNLAFAQQLNFNENTFFYPHSYNPGQIVSSLGIALAKLPEDVVETDDVFRAPLFSYRLKYGLPENFLAEGSVESNIVTYNFMLGPKWNYEIDKWGFSLGTDLSYYFGKLEQFGFDTKFTGWALYPNISAGYQFEKFTISLKSELVFNLAETSKNGESEIENDLDFFNGWTIGAYLEQPFWGDNYVVLGVRSTFLKFYYPMWAAFSTFDRSFYIPEATFTFIF